MAERIRTGYSRLFELRILHHYWLDGEINGGATPFDQLPQDAQLRRLLPYDIRSFASVAPTAGTTKAMRAWGGLFRETALGCVVLVPNGTVIPATAQMDFVFAVHSSLFHRYTALTYRAQQIHEVYHSTDRTRYRFKERVFVLSNRTGTSRVFAGTKQLFLSAEIPAALTAADGVESLARIGAAVVQLTGDNPGAATATIGTPVNSVPVFVNQADMPALVAPPDVVGVPARGLQLSDDIPDDVFALVRLSATGGADADFDLIDGAGHAKASCPMFQVRLKNRSTFWNYRNAHNGAAISAGAAPQPLTYHGNAGLPENKPSTGFVKAEMVGNAINKLVSEIFK